MEEKMKKGCIGCLGVLGVLLLAVLGAVLYFGPNDDIYLLPPVLSNTQNLL